MQNAPGHIDRGKNHNEQRKGGFIVLEWEEAGCDNQKDKCPDEIRVRPDNTLSKEGLHNEAASIMVEGG